MTPYDLQCWIEGLDDDEMDRDIEVHFQPNYPLKGSLMNMRHLKGVPTLAIGDGYEYGSKAAWDTDDGEECDYCGKIYHGGKCYECRD